MRRPTGQTKPAHLRTEERRARVLGLRTAGLTYRRIAAAMWADAAWHGRLPPSYNARHVHEDVTVALMRQRAELDEAVGIVRQQELDRLDKMLLGVWERAQRGDDRAIASVLGIMDRRRRLLPGLEAPQQIAPTHPDRTEAPASLEESSQVAYQLAAYGLFHGNGLVTDPGESG